MVFAKKNRVGWRIYYLWGMAVFALPRKTISAFENKSGLLPEKTFLFTTGKLRTGFSKSGLFSYFIENVGWIRYAVTHGMIPVVDMQTNRNAYQQNDGDNGWENYFEQPCGYDMEIRKVCAHGLVTVGRLSEDERPDVRMDFFENGAELSIWRELATRYIRPLPAVKHRVDEFVRTRSVDFTKTVGVLMRGTDYLALRPSGHPVQPSVEMVIADVRHILDRDDYASGRVLLLTEDSQMAAAMRNAFGERLLEIPQKRPTYLGGYLSETEGVRGNVEMGMAYLVGVLLLSKCSALVAGRTSGSVGAAILSSRGFKVQKFYDLGLY